MKSINSVFVLLLLLIFGCKKKCADTTHISEPRDFLNYFAKYKPGNYFIFSNADQSVFDTLTILSVDSNLTRTNAEDKRDCNECMDYRYEMRWTHSLRYNSAQLLIGPGGTSSEGICNKYYFKLLLESYSGVCFINSTSEIEPLKDNYELQNLGNYSLDNLEFQKAIKVLSDENRLQQEAYYIYAQEYGIIEYSSPSKNDTFRLVNFGSI